MPLSNSNNAYAPHKNSTFHEGAQKNINGERDNAPYHPNTRDKSLK